MTAPAPRAWRSARRSPSVLDAQLRKHGHDRKAVHPALRRHAMCRQLQRPEALPGTVLASIRRGCKDLAALQQLEAG